jgi:hypothetical protein
MSGLNHLGLINSASIQINFVRTNAEAIAMSIECHWDVGQLRTDIDYVKVTLA